MTESNIYYAVKITCENGSAFFALGPGGSAARFHRFAEAASFAKELRLDLTSKTKAVKVRVTTEEL